MAKFKIGDIALYEDGYGINYIGIVSEVIFSRYGILYTVCHNLNDQKHSDHIYFDDEYYSPSGGVSEFNIIGKVGNIDNVIPLTDADCGAEKI